MKTEAEIRQALRQWILTKNPALLPEGLADNTPIVELRLLPSIQIMDFILFLEQLRDAPVEVESLKAGVFRDINTVYANFFGDT